MLPLQRPTPDFLLFAYRRGYFPMALGRGWHGPLAWFNPEERGILPLDTFHVPRRLAERVRSGRFIITSDEDFEGVIRACAEPRPGEAETWINDEIVQAYSQLYRAGRAHSVEAWLPAPEGRRLVGGVYGVHIGGAFFAESKFSRPGLGGTDASKVCLVHLVRHLQLRGFSLLDTQMWNPHLAQFGCVEISRAEYLRRLDEALGREVTWGRLDPDAARTGM